MYRLAKKNSGFTCPAVYVNKFSNLFDASINKKVVKVFKAPDFRIFSQKFEVGSYKEKKKYKSFGCDFVNYVY